MSNGLHTKQIEMLSVNHLEIDLTKTGYLNPYINSGDNEPSWDGYVYVIEKEKIYTKKNLGKTPVQVKGKYCEELDSPKIMYPVDIQDLKNFLQDGGVLYFVVYVTVEGHSIYYAPLEPIKIKELLIGINDTQKTKNIRFSKLPTNDIEIVNIFKSFLYNRKKQMSFIDEKIFTLDEIMDVKGAELTFTLTGLELNQDNFQNYVDSNNVYMYARLPESPILVPLTGSIKELVEVEKADLRISIGDKVYYTEQIRERSKETVCLKFGDSFEFIIDENSNNHSFNYRISSSLRSSLIDLEFLISMQKSKGFEINGKFVDFSKAIDSTPEFDYEMYNKWFDHCKKVVDLLDYLNITGDLNCTKLSDREWRDIDALVKGLILNEEVRLRDGLQTFHIIKIQNYFIPLILHKQKYDHYLIEELFHVRKRKLYLSIPPDEFLYTVPIFRCLTAEQLVQCSTLKFETLLDEYQKLHTSKNDILFDANQFLLRLITAADLCNTSLEKKEKFLKTCLKFVCWLEEENTINGELDPDILKLNEFQIIKRQRDLTSSEVEWLFELSEATSKDDMLKFGAYVLLGESKRAKRIFSKFSEEEQEEYRQYPIYSLLNINDKE